MKRACVLSPALLLAGCIVVPQSHSRWAPAPQPAPVPVVSEPMVPSPLPPPPAEVIVAAPPPLDESQIGFAYEAELDRPPSPREVWEWRERSRERPTSPDDLRRALHESYEFRQVVPDRVIRRAFLDYHHIEPTAEEKSLYRRRMLDEGWSIDRVRRDISRRTVAVPVPEPRRDDRGANRGDNDQGHRDEGDDRGRHEGQGRRGDRDGRSFDAMVTRAYRDVLERTPDPAGRANYIRRLEQGASEEDVRAALRQSEEFRVILPDAKTKRAYQEVLGREPDEGGLQHYRKLIVDKGWTENDVKNDLRKSAEFRNRPR